MLACAPTAVRGVQSLALESAATGRREVAVRLSPFPSQARWTLALNAAIVSPPVFDGASGYFPVEGDRILAYDLETGTPRWTASARLVSAPVTGDGLLFVAKTDALVALRANDGSVAWQIPFPERLASRLVWDNGWLMAATDTALLAFRAADGTLVWRRDLASASRSAPALAGDSAYISLEDGRIAAFRVTDGGPLWERRLGSPPNGIRALEDRLFVGANDNFLYCLNAHNGQVEWRWRTGADVVSTPLVDARRVYFVSLDNVLRALNRSNGVQQWKRALPFRPEWGPIEAADTLVVAGLAGPARAFYIKDGGPAGELSIGGDVELAAPLHAFESAGVLGPIIVVVTRGLTSGANVTASSRAIEPPLLKSLAPLPGVLPAIVPTDEPTDR